MFTVKSVLSGNSGVQWRSRRPVSSVNGRGKNQYNGHYHATSYLTCTLDISLVFLSLICPGWLLANIHSGPYWLDLTCWTNDCIFKIIGITGKSNGREFTLQHWRDWDVLPAPTEPVPPTAPGWHLNRSAGRDLTSRLAPARESRREVNEKPCLYVCLHSHCRPAC